MKYIGIIAVFLFAEAALCADVSHSAAPTTAPTTRATVPTTGPTSRPTTNPILGENLSTWPANFKMQPKTTITTYAGNDYVIIMDKTVKAPGDDLKGASNCVLDSNEKSDSARPLQPEVNGKPNYIEIDGSPKIDPRSTTVNDQQVVTATAVTFKIKQGAGQQFKELRCWIDGKKPADVTASDIRGQLEDVIQFYPE